MFMSTHIIVFHLFRNIENEVIVDECDHDSDCPSDKPNCYQPLNRCYKGNKTYKKYGVTNILDMLYHDKSIDN